MLTIGDLGVKVRPLFIILHLILAALLLTGSLRKQQVVVIREEAKGPPTRGRVWHVGVIGSSSLKVGRSGRNLGLLGMVLVSEEKSRVGKQQDFSGKLEGTRNKSCPLLMVPEPGL